MENIIRKGLCFFYAHNTGLIYTDLFSINFIYNFVRMSKDNISIQSPITESKIIQSGITTNLIIQSPIGIESTTPPILEDGNTVGWYDYLENVTQDGNDLVSVWGDKSGQGNDLLQVDPLKQPFLGADGVLFPGVQEFMQTPSFTLVQPEMVYIVFKQLAWANALRIFEGIEINSTILAQRGVTPDLQLYSGAWSLSNSNLPLNTFGIARALFDGASSKLIINDTTPLIGNFGTTDSNGFTLAAKFDGLSGFSNTQVKEIIIRKIADTAPNEQIIYDYLAGKYSI